MRVRERGDRKEREHGEINKFSPYLPGGLLVVCGSIYASYIADVNPRSKKGMGKFGKRG